jgi:RNA polymerase primary sigma factor
MQEVLGAEDHTLQLYFHDIIGSTPLSREREVGLSVRIQQGDLQARDELVQANLRFVVDVAKNFQNRGLPFCELISAGNLGLLTAADRFDGAKGFKFISYAVWWIRQSILQTIAEQGRTVRLPLNRQSLLRGISKAAQRLGQGSERTPAVEEIAAEMEISAEEVENTLLSARTTLSLDEAFGEDDERGLLSTLEDTSQESPDAEVLRESARKQLQEVLNSLNERELRVIRLYFGLEGKEALTLEQIGAGLGITRERVRQIKEIAFSKLRHPHRAPALRALVGEVPPAP